MKTTIGLILMMTVLLAGCAGRQPDPVPVYLPGDENRSCDSLKKEIVDIQNKMLALLPKTDKTVSNTLWSVSATVAGNAAAATIACCS
jgi:PBP1b-binding outer membrane lipoprotein LpoB